MATGGGLAGGRYGSAAILWRFIDRGVNRGEVMLYGNTGDQCQPRWRPMKISAMAPTTEARQPAGR